MPTVGYITKYCQHVETFDDDPLEHLPLPSDANITDASPPPQASAKAQGKRKVK
jgi:hypothetical protein